MRGTTLVVILALVVGVVAGRATVEPETETAVIENCEEVPE